MHDVSEEVRNSAWTLGELASVVASATVMMTRCHHMQPTDGGVQYGSVRLEFG